MTPEAELRQDNSSELRDFVENILAPLHWIGSDGKILWANQAELDLLGYSRDEYIGRHIWEFHADRPAIDDILARLRNDETLRNYEARLRHKDGSLRHVLISSSVLWRDRQFVHTRCLTIDVTERKRAEDERELVERNLSSQYAVTKVLAEATTLEEATGRLLQGVGEVGNWSVGALWTVDEAGKALRCLNVWRAADANLEEFAAITREMTFAPSVGLPGRVWSTATPAWIEDVVKDPNFPRAAHAERAGLHGALGFPVRIRDRVTGVLEFLSRDVRQPDRNLLQLFDAIGTQIGQFMDRRQSDELRARMAAIVDSSDDAIISKTLDGVITSWNRGAEDIFGYTANEAVGQNISLIIPADRIGEERDVLTRLRRGEKIEHFETERRAKDGRRLSISLTVSPVRNADGQIVGASKVARDITDRKQAEEVLRLSKQQAEEAVNARDEFLSIAAHELRNPLNALQLQLVGLQRAAQDRQDFLPKAWVCERIGQATDDVRRLVRLMHNLLDVSRITAGRIDLEPEDLDFRPIVHSVVGRFVAQVKDGAITVDASPVSGRWDRQRLDQIVTNLLSNAVKYGQGRPIDISLAHDAEHVHLSITDRGIGIDAEQQERLFKRFERGVSHRHYRGFGLGLWITREIVEAMGGRISVESSPGSGSTFAVVLPRQPASSKAAQ